MPAGMALVRSAGALARVLGKGLGRVLGTELPMAWMQARRLGWEQQWGSQGPEGPAEHHLAMQSACIYDLLVI